MGYDFWSKQLGPFCANVSGWDHLTEAALAFGWKPAGTHATRTDGKPLNGTYFSNDDQIVTEEDARELAGALRRAIAAAEDGDSIEVANLSARAENAMKSLDVSYVREFAEFCEQGAFRIG